MAKTMRGAEDPTDEELAAAAPAAPATVTFEFVGEPPYGREFVDKHTIHKSSADPEHKTEKLSFAGQGIEVPEDLVWHPGNNWKVKVSADLEDLVEGLRAQSFLKEVKK